MIDIKTPAHQHLLTLEAVLAPSLDSGEGPLGPRALDIIGTAIGKVAAAGAI
jgi:hypothetical protein